MKVYFLVSEYLGICEHQRIKYYLEGYSFVNCYVFFLYFHKCVFNHTWLIFVGKGWSGDLNYCQTC